MSSESLPNNDRSGVGISTLPVEILRQIIIHAATNDPHKYIYKNSHGFDDENLIHLGWILITHVSRLWREVALTTQSLWTDIVLNFGRTCAAEMIRRSGPTASISVLTADCRDWDVDMYETFDAIVPPMLNRVERLELGGNFGARDLRHMYAQLMSTPAPALRSLHLTNVSYWSGDIDIVFDGLFARHTPLLSTLRLDHVAFPATSIYMFKNLKHLELESGGDDSDIYPSPAELVSASAQMPLLETLSVIRYVLADWTDDGPPSLSSHRFVTVRLPNLRTLTMEGHRHVLDYLCRHIECPASCVVSEKILSLS